MGKRRINTVTGQVAADDLGPTLIHEHLIIGLPGWESDSIRPGLGHEEMIEKCIKKVDQIQARGIRTMVDPCPNDMGRDVAFMAEIADRTGLQIICATGLYTENEGGAPYWKFKTKFGPVEENMAELFVRELTEGIGDTGIKAGVIKVGTGHGDITKYEEWVLGAAATASNEAGVPIMTHTDKGMLGDKQQQFLIDRNVPPHRILIGHSCGTSDHDYHHRIAANGSYVGFDRFGVAVMPDEERIKSVMALMEKGKLRNIIVSHDSVWCWLGEPISSPEMKDLMEDMLNPCRLHDEIFPQMRSMGATDEQINTMLVENPKRFFSDEVI